MFVHRQENITISQCDFALCRRNQLKRYKKWRYYTHNINIANYFFNIVAKNLLNGQRQIENDAID